MRGVTCLLVAVAAAWAGSVEGQELRGFLILEGDPGYLTNAYLDPGFGTWTPEIETAFGTAGATGLLEWTGERTSLNAAAGGRWIGFADSTSAWHAYLIRGGLERRVGGAVALAVDGSFSDVRRSEEERRTLWGQARLRWTASSRVRVTIGPGIARRRFVPPSEAGDGGLFEPPVPPDGPTSADVAPRPGRQEGGEAEAISYLGFVGLEAWPGTRWQVRVDGYAAHTEAAELGIDYRGGGGSLRLTRWLGDGAWLRLGAGLEGFGFRAATETGDPSTLPEDDLIWHSELAAGWPLARRAELRGRLAGVGRSGASGSEGPDVYATAGLRVTLGGTISSPRHRAVRWSPTPEGMEVRVPYEGSGRLYLVGDFNDWAKPGLPLRPAGGGVHVGILRLEPGSYRYRIRVVRGEEERWLEWPEGTPTVSDGFGGTNGLVVVGEDAATTPEEERDDEVG